MEDFDKLLHETEVEHVVIVDPDSGHAHFRDSDPDVYQAGASRDAWDRVTEFFGKHLFGTAGVFEGRPVLQ